MWPSSSVSLSSLVWYAAVPATIPGVQYPHWDAKLFANDSQSCFPVFESPTALVVMKVFPSHFYHFKITAFICQSNPSIFETFLSQGNKTRRHSSTSGFTSGIDHFDNRTCTTSTLFTHLLDISLTILTKVWKQSIIYIDFWCFIFILVHCKSFSSSRTSISFDFNVFKILFINFNTYAPTIFSVRRPWRLNWAWYCPSSDSCALWNRLSKDEIESAKLAHDYDD